MNALAMRRYADPIVAGLVVIRLTLGKIAAQPKGLIGLIVVLCYAVLALTGAWLAPHSPYAQNFLTTLQPPSATFWFGTDALGRDVLSRIMTGAATSLGIGFGGVVFAFLVGVPIGVFSAYMGGRMDLLTMRAVDIMLSFPDIILALAIVAILGASTQNVVLAVGFVSVPIFARTARAVTLTTLAEPYIEGTISLGASPLRVVLRHVLPNIMGVLLTLSSLLFATTMLTAAGLGFLGLGAQPPHPEWGVMLGESRSYIRSHPYLATFPGVFLALSALGFNLLGEALRTIYDPAAPKSYHRFFRRRARRVDPVSARMSTTAASPDAKVRVDNLRIAYLTPAGPVQTVRDVSLTLTQGRTLAIVGESGSGKSTLLRAIATLLPLGNAVMTGGSIIVGGQRVETLDRRGICALRRRHIGVVFQDAANALNPMLTIGAQLAEAILADQPQSSKANVHEQAVALLNHVRISDPQRRLRMYPHQLSGGMKQRVVIAMALAQNPEVLLADEPTSALDVTIQQQILSLLRELQQQRGMTMLLVTHDLGLVVRYADDVAVMYAGQLVESGSVQAVFRQPCHPYTLALRGSSPGFATQSLDRMLPAIPGEPPIISALPDGCAFRPRCSLCAGRSVCAQVQPTLRPLGSQQAACHFAEELSS